ncbi:hypothetical protein BH10BAC1_BH10BAC1_17690 [soil metagenome]
MQKTFFVSFFILFSCCLFSQAMERKIIIQNGNYFFTTIDEDNQLATLNTGKDTSSLKKAKRLIMPVGRNFDDPIIPFSWDVAGENVYAISFLLHPLNDRNEAIKRMSISSFAEWSPPVKPMELINTGVEMNPFAYNDPYLFVTRRSNMLNGFFYDAVALNDTSYTMAISNNGELSIWNYNGKEWKHSEIQKFPVDGFFSLFTYKNTIYLATNVGGLYEISTKGIIAAKNKSVGCNLSKCTLIINKDEETVSYIKNSDIDYSTALNELLKKKAVRIF